MSGDDDEDDLKAQVEKLRSERAQARKDEFQEECNEWIWASGPQAFVRTSDQTIWNEKQFSTHFAHFVTKGSAGAYVLRHSMVKKYEGFKFVPNAPHDLGVNYNLWRPGGVEAKEGDVQWFVDHLEYLFCGDKVQIEYVLDYLSLLVREPHTKIMFALLIYGKHHGTGKSAIAEMLKRMLGPANCRTPSNDEVSGTYTVWQEGVQLAIINELFMLGKFELSNRLKDNITSPNLRIRTMYRPHYDADNVLNFYCTTNHGNALALENADRRWLVTASNAEPHPEGEAYYTRLFDHITNDDDLGAVKWFLQNRKCGLNPNGRAPTTEAKRQMQEQSMQDVEVLLKELYDEGLKPFDFPLVRRDDLVDVVQNRLYGAQRNILNRCTSFLRDVVGAKDHAPDKNGGGRRAYRLWSLKDHDKWEEAGPAARYDAYLAHMEGRPAEDFEDDGL